MNESIKKFFSHSTVQTWIVIGGLAITLVNLYIAYRISPLVQDINTLATKVEANEVRDEKARTLVERFYVVEQQSKDIKERLVRMEDKIDGLLER